MTGHRALPSALVFLIGLALIFPTWGCANSSSTGGPGTGALRIQHAAASFGIVDRIVVRAQVGVQTFEFDVSLPPGDSHTVTELLTGLYDVDITWEGGHADTYMNVLVREQETTEQMVSR